MVLPVEKVESSFFVSSDFTIHEVFVAEGVPLLLLFDWVLLMPPLIVEFMIS